MIEVVVFDMDDTLYDEVDYCASGFNAVADFLARSFPSRTPDKILHALWTQFQAGNHTRTFNAALEQLQIPYDDDFIKAMVKTYREHFPSITLPEESKAVLEILCKRYKLAMLTDGFLPAQRYKTQALGIEKYFQTVVYTEELGREHWKPSPAGFEIILKYFGLPPSRCVYIADNDLKDFIAPNKLGYRTIQVLRANRVHRQTTDDANASAQLVTDCLAKLPELFTSL